MNMLARFALLMPVVAIGLASTQVASQGSQEWVYAVIKDYGKVRPYPNAAAQPESGKQYKILFSLTKPPESVDKVNPGLEHVARLINIFAFAKVPVENSRRTKCPISSGTTYSFQSKPIRGSA